MPSSPSCRSLRSAPGRSGRRSEAIRAGNREEIQKLLKDPAAVKATEADGTTPLHWAVRADDVETSKALLKAGANASAANRYGVTPLSLAAVNGNAALIEALLRWCQREQHRVKGQTVLMTAARTGNPAAVRVSSKAAPTSTPANPNSAKQR